MSPNTKSRRSSQFFQSNNNSFVLPSNNDVSILGGEYSDVSMLYWNGTEKIHQDNTARDNEAREFKNEYDITFDQKYNMNSNPNHRIVTKEIALPSGVKERWFKSGVIEKIYPRIKKERFFPDGYSITFFANGNVIQVYPNKEKIVKYDKEKKITKTIFSDGLVAFKDSNKLVKFYSDGSQVICHSDGMKKIIDPTNAMKIVFPDGTIQRVMNSVNKINMKVFEKSIIESNM